MTRRSAIPVALAMFLVVPLVLAACIPPRPSPTVAPPTQISEPSSPAPSASAASPAAASAATVAVDPALLAVLPDQVMGVPITPDPSTAADIAAEGSIAPFVSGIALATAFGPPASATRPDYVVITVTRLRPGTFSDIFFQGWRDTFDEGVCQQAGGVAAGKAETDIGGHRTFIGTCNGGVHTYHVHIGSDRIVSMQGSGDGGWPERIIADLAE